MEYDPRITAIHPIMDATVSFSQLLSSMRFKTALWQLLKVAYSVALAVARS